MRQQLIDYFGARSPNGTSSLSFSSMRRHPTQLLWYSRSGWDMVPISQENFRTGRAPYFSRRFFLVHETTTYSTTAVLDLWRDTLPISSETSSLLPRPRDDKGFDYHGTRPSEEHISHIPRGFLLVHETTQSTTKVLDIWMGHASLRYSIYGWDKTPISQEELSAHEATID